MERIESAEIHRVRVHPEPASILGGLLEGAARTGRESPQIRASVGAVILKLPRIARRGASKHRSRRSSGAFVDLIPDENAPKPAPTSAVPAAGQCKRTDRLGCGDGMVACSLNASGPATAWEIYANP